MKNETHGEDVRRTLKSIELRRRQVIASIEVPGGTGGLSDEELMHGWRY